MHDDEHCNYAAMRLLTDMPRIQAQKMGLHCSIAICYSHMEHCMKSKLAKPHCQMHC